VTPLPPIVLDFTTRRAATGLIELTTGLTPIPAADIVAEVRLSVTPGDLPGLLDSLDVIRAWLAERGAV
jgi:hypothetical protein